MESTVASPIKITATFILIFVLCSDCSEDLDIDLMYIAEQKWYLFGIARFGATSQDAFWLPLDVTITAENLNLKPHSSLPDTTSSISIRLIFRCSNTSSSWYKFIDLSQLRMPGTEPQLMGRYCSSASLTAFQNIHTKHDCSLGLLLIIVRKLNSEMLLILNSKTRYSDNRFNISNFVESYSSKILQQFNSDLLEKSNITFAHQWKHGNCSESRDSCTRLPPRSHQYNEIAQRNYGAFAFTFLVLVIGFVCLVRLFYTVFIKFLKKRQNSVYPLIM